MVKSIIFILSVMILLFFIFVATTVVKADTVTTYKVNGSLRSTLEEHINVPDIIKNANIKVILTAFPKQRYYKQELILLAPYNKLGNLTKTVEIWDDRGIIRSTVDVDLTLRSRLLKRIIEPRIENMILNIERCFIQSKLK